jgi:two-component system chemotaxis sensor kinase CheA
MDTSEYMPMFLAESREHLQELNLAVVRLEENPEDRPTLDEIFRIAHSLKGMSGTMGFALIAELTHEMEEVFELLRQRSGALSGDAVDTVLACLDALSAAVDSIESDGTEQLDPAPLSKRLRQLVRSGADDRRKDPERQQSGDRRKRTPKKAPIERAATENEAETAADDDAPAESAPMLDDTLRAVLETLGNADDGSRLLRVVATLDDEVMMPAARALMMQSTVTEHGEVVRSDPHSDDIETFQGRRIEMWLVSQVEEEQLEKAVSAITDIVAVAVSAVSASGGGPVPDIGQHDEPARAEDEEPEPEPTHDVVDETPTASAEKPTAVPVEKPTAAPAAAAPANHAARTVRVDSERLDALMHSMGELVIHRTAVEALTAGLDMPELQQAVQDLTRSSHALQAMVMQVRMIPVDIVFLRFPRLVRDLSTKLGKQVELQLVGKETELDRTVVDALGDPLVHLVRNALDHGLESPEERRAAGKPEVGTLEIAARHAGGSVVIEVRDDGHGINPQAVAAKAVKRGLIDADTADSIDMRGAVELLFSPGFSMAEVASDISGRGVGMDAVRTKIRELGGEVVLDSQLGVGTTAQIRLPLTLAIVSALQVDIAGAPFAIPLDRVERTLRLDPRMVRSVAGKRMLVLEDGVLPLLEGARTFRREPTAEHELIVLVRGEDRRLGLAVDELVGQRELVTRPLPSIVSDGEPVSGGAVLADGRIALIVDCDAMAQRILNGSAAGGPGTTIPTTASNAGAEELAA